MKIPKIFHTIWAGGEKLFPISNIEVILEWMQNNPDMAIWLWVDQKTAPEELDLKKYYEEKFKEILQESDKIIKSDQNLQVNLKKLYIKDIAEEGMEDPYIRYEIDRLRPNYGASSDQLRYKIVYRFGGAYFDSDVGVGQTPLGQSGIFDADYRAPVLFVDFNCQDKGILGNDFFIATPENLLMEQLDMLIKHNYSSVDSPYTKIYYQYDSVMIIEDNFYKDAQSKCAHTCLISRLI
jgi:Glycosyltransferase sugar-binding region containing DXD motif